MNKKITVGVSGRHAHVSQQDLEVLFGEGYELTVLKDLSQPGQFAANERIDVVGPKGTLKVRILGPVRSRSQVELSMTDSFVLGVEGVVRNSGDVSGTPGAILRGPAGEVTIDDGIIVAARHMHLHSDDAKNFGVKDKQIVSVRTSGDRGITFANVLCRVDDSFALDFHIDTDEANAGAIKNGEEVELIV